MCASRTLQFSTARPSMRLLSVSFRHGCWWLCPARARWCQNTRTSLAERRDSPVCVHLTEPLGLVEFPRESLGQMFTVSHQRSKRASDERILKLWKAELCQPLPLRQRGGRDPCWPAGNPMVWSCHHRHLSHGRVQPGTSGRLDGVKLGNQRASCKTHAQNLTDFWSMN